MRLYDCPLYLLDPFGLTTFLSLVCQISALVTRALLLELRLRLKRLKLTQLHFSDPFAQDRQTQTASLCDLVYWLDLSDLSDLSSLGHFHAHSFDAATHKIRTNSNHWNRLGRWCFRCFGISWRHWRHSAFFEARCSPRSRPQTLRRNTVVIRHTSFHKHVMHVMQCRPQLEGAPKRIVESDDFFDRRLGWLHDAIATSRTTSLFLLGHVY